MKGIPYYMMGCCAAMKGCPVVYNFAASAWASIGVKYRGMRPVR